MDISLVRITRVKKRSDFSEKNNQSIDAGKESMYRNKFLLKIFVCLSAYTHLMAADSLNQTDALSPVLSGDSLPFKIVIQQAHFELPVGIHSGASACHEGLWVFIAGRINGLHGFNDPQNFPPDSQNYSVYVVDPKSGITASRPLNDPTSGLTQQQIDWLSVTSPQSYQAGQKLYMTGGYGVDSDTGNYSTKPILSVINIPGIIAWVLNPQGTGQTAAQNIRQLYHPIFQVTGGAMFKSGDLTLLIFGQDFEGSYTTNSNGNYTEKVRRFYILDEGKRLSVKPLKPFPKVADPSYRRRDLNIVSVIDPTSNCFRTQWIAFGGVFTLAGGVWTVPVEINKKGVSFMKNPQLEKTFKQAMSQYVCANVGLYSKKHQAMYSTFFGGISLGFFENGVFETDSEIPFINQVTTIKWDHKGQFSQYLMEGEYPYIPSSQSTPLLFGAGAYFFNAQVPAYKNGVIKLDKIHHPILLGYIVGGIQSAKANTDSSSQSAASPYVFTVTLIPQDDHR